jgi:hypothetical protein
VSRRRTPEKDQLSGLHKSVDVDIRRSNVLLFAGISRYCTTKRNFRVRQVLVLQQTRIVDEKGQLKTTFPSRTDFDWKEIEQGSIVVERLNIKK